MSGWMRKHWMCITTSPKGRGVDRKSLHTYRLAHLFRNVLNLRRRIKKRKKGDIARGNSSLYYETNIQQTGLHNPDILEFRGINMNENSTQFQSTTKQDTDQLWKRNLNHGKFQSRKFSSNECTNRVHECDSSIIFSLSKVQFSLTIKHCDNKEKLRTSLVKKTTTFRHSLNIIIKSTEWIKWEQI